MPIALSDNMDKQRHRASASPRSAPGAANDQTFPQASDPSSARGYLVTPLRNAEQQHIACTLVRRRYAWRGYHTDALAHRADESRRLTLGAWLSDELAATLTLACDAPEGFHNEALYAREIADLRRPGRVLCEVSRLAIDPDFSCPKLLRTLFAEAVALGIERFAASDVVIGVNPRHAAYYQRCLGFRQIGARRHCPQVDAPVVLLHQTVGAMSALAAAGALCA